MTILYRALWTDGLGEDPAGSFERMREAAWQWAIERSDKVVVEGRTIVPLSPARIRQINIRTFDADESTTAFELQTEDSGNASTAVWMTTVRILMRDNSFLTMIENRMESDDPTTPISVGRPGVVHSLLKLAKNPLMGTSPLLSEPVTVGAAGVGILLEALASEGREVPFVVCTDPGGNDKRWKHRATHLAKRLEGVASVLTLDGAAVTAFRKELGDLAVWGGGIRIYMPTVVDRLSPARMHRYYTLQRIADNEKVVTDRIVQSVAQVSTRRRVPEQFRVFNALERQPAPSPSGAISQEDFDSARADWAAQSEVYERVALDLEADVEQLRDDLGQAEEELARNIAHFERLKHALSESNLIHLFWGTQHEVASDIPDTAQDMDEAVLAAQSYLEDWVCIADEAARDLEKLTSGPNASAWGNSTWRAFRALAAYAEDCATGWNTGGFWEWCSSGRPGVWPATPKKLSMTESESVLNSAKLRRRRLLPVSTAVSSSGSIEMLAHIKVAEGGGNLTPRIYFHDDTGGVTKKMHVGFVGPHYLMPNKSTN